MAIKTRQTTATGVTNKDAPLTNDELDNNFVELQQNKYQSGDNIDVGTVTADGLTVDGNIKLDGNGRLLQVDKNVSGTDNVFYYDNTVSTNDLYIGRDSSNLRLRTSGQNRLLIDSDGDISFYEDLGSDAKFFWDASAESLGIGTTSPMLNSDGILGLEIKGATPGLTIANSTGGHIYSTWVDTSDNYILQDNTNNASRIVVSSAGNVGIGVTPENSSGTWRNFQFGGGNASYRSNGANDAMIGTGYVFKTDNSEVYKNTEAVSRIFFNNNAMSFQQAGSGTAGTAISWTDAMTLDASGNLLIGMTNDTPGLGDTDVGSSFRADGASFVSRTPPDTSGSTFYVNRNTYDGNLVQFQKDGTTVGSIGTTGGDLFIASSDTGHEGLRFGNGAITPVGTTGASTDAACNLGGATSRFNELYLGGDLNADEDINLTVTDSSVPIRRIRFDKTGNSTNTTGAGAYIQFDTSTGSTERGEHNARIEGIRSAAGDGSSQLDFYTSKNISASDRSAKLQMRIKDDGDITVYNNMSFGIPGNGPNADGRFISIEGNAQSDNGEASGRIFFSEHNNTTSSMDAYGLSIGYRGGQTTITGASGNDWTGLSAIGNGQWGMWGHDADNTGDLIMYGDRAATFVKFETDVGIGVEPSTPVHVRRSSAGNVATLDSTGNATLYLQSNASSFDIVPANSSGSAGPLKIRPSGVATALTMTATGNIGIGVDSPQKLLDVNIGANEVVTVGAGTFAAGNYAGIHFGYRENNANYRKSAIVFERTDLTSGNAQGKVHILNGPQSGSGSATLSDAKLTIAEDGDIGIGTTSPSAPLNVVGGGSTSSTVRLVGGSNNDNATIAAKYSMIFQVNADNNQASRSFHWRNGGKGYSDGTLQMLLDSSSNLTVTGEVTVNSDERIKDNIEQIPDALEKIQSIRGVTYNRTDLDDNEKRHAGVIAQDVEKVLPEVVTENEETGIKSVAYANMVGLLIEAIKEQQTQIDDLKAEVTRLKGFE